MSRLTRASAGARLQGLYPALGPWTSAALWHGITKPELPTAPLEQDLGQIRAQRLTPLLLRLCDERGWPLTEEQRGALEVEAFMWETLSTSARSAGRAVLGMLEAAGIPAAVTKGPGIAAHYEPPLLRPYTDVDLLVRPRDFDRSMRLLAREGYRPAEASRQPWPYFDRWCREGVNLTGPAGERVDVHHHVPPWHWSRRLDAASLLGRAQAPRSQGMPLVPAEDNLLVAALHLVTDRNRAGRSLLIWRDVVQLGSSVDPGSAVARAREVRLDGWLRHVLLALPEEVRPTALLQRLEDGPLSPLPAAGRLAVLLSPVPAHLGARSSQALRLPVPAAAWCLAGALLPSRSFLHAKDPAAGAYPVLWARRAARSWRSVRSSWQPRG
nr:nucleotidyltransferase family protein [Motilibacter aurantiacus]